MRPTIQHTRSQPINVKRGGQWEINANKNPSDCGNMSEWMRTDWHEMNSILSNAQKMNWNNWKWKEIERTWFWTFITSSATLHSVLVYRMQCTM